MVPLVCSVRVICAEVSVPLECRRKRTRRVCERQNDDSARDRRRTRTWDRSVMFVDIPIQRCAQQVLVPRTFVPRSLVRP